MIRTKIILEGTLLDLYDDIDTSFTFAIDDVANFAEINTSFSKTIVIPGNSTNNKALGHVFNFGSSNFYNPTQPNVGYNFNPSVSAACIVLVDNIQVFKGKLRLMEIVDTDGTIEYECFIFGELGGLINQLGNRRLEDLDFSDYNLTYSFTNITNSWDAVTGGGVYFPLIDYGNVSTNKEDFQYTAFRPALYVREYLERIFAQTTYTVQSNFLLSSLFDTLVITQNQKTLTNRTNDVLELSISSQKDMFDEDAPGGIDVPFDNVTGALFTPSGGNTVFTYNGVDSITVTFVIVFQGTYSFANASNGMTLSVIKNGVQVPGSVEVYPFTNGFSTTFNYSKTITVSLATNDTLTFEFFSDGVGFDPTDFILLDQADVAGTSSTPSSVPVELGDTININDSIPRGIFQRDFLLSIVKMFKLYIYELPFDENKLVITPYVDFYPADGQNALDWSKKIDRSQPIRQTPMSELNARYYRFKYREDNDFYNEEYRKAYNEGYGDRIFDTEFEFSNETDTLEVIFANSVLYQNTGTDKIYPAIYKLSGTTETPMDHIIRIGRAKKITCNAYDILDGVSVVGSPTSYGYVGHLDDPTNPSSDLCFGAPNVLQFTPGAAYPSTNLFSFYHSDYISEITSKDSKLITCYAYLTCVDIMQLDFSKFIWVDGTLFRLNKVIDFDPINLGTTEIQLLKVIDL